MEIFNCEQNSEAWLRARMGIPTASAFATVMASGRGGGDSKTRKTYMLKLAGEIITGQPAENYVNADMRRGHEMEDEARKHYAFVNDCEPEKVGFVRNGQMGGSPDSLIGSDGILEIKTKAPHVFIECMLRDDFPPEHKAQSQGLLLVTGREWVDLKPYWPAMPNCVFRAYRDEPYIADMKRAIDIFNVELHELVEQIRKRGLPAKAAA